MNGFNGFNYLPQTIQVILPKLYVAATFISEKSPNLFCPVYRKGTQDPLRHRANHPIRFWALRNIMEGGGRSRGEFVEMCPVFLGKYLCL